MRLLPLLIFLSLSACTSGTEGRVVGTWEPAAGTDGPRMRYTFFSDGRALLVARPDIGEPQTFDARFTVSGDTLLSLHDSEGTERFGFSLAQDTLHLTSRATGITAAFVRVRTGG